MPNENNNTGNGTAVATPPAPTSAPTLTPEQVAEQKKAARIKELRAELDKLEPPDESMDKYGRTAFERTIELEVDDAERVDAEVVTGKHDTFADGLHYIIERGIAEIKRQRESLAKLAEQRKDAKAMAALRTLVGNDPAIVDSPDLGKMLKAMGIVLGKK